jgi:hypothetical protein
VEKVLDSTGFAKVDQFFKEVYAQGALDKARNTSKDKFVAEHKAEYGEEEANKVWEDIQKGDVKSDSVLTYIFSEISEMQPISLSEMSKGYLESGNLRILYTLKSYSMKLLSTMRKDMLEEAAKGNYKEATANFMKMIPMLVIANASIDELKDWMQGKEEPFSDNVINNMLKLFMVNRYSLDKVADRGIGDILTEQVTPPILRPINDLTKDIFNLFPGGDKPTYKSLANIPSLPIGGLIGSPLRVGGRLAYKWTPEGRERTKNSVKRSIRDDIRKGKSTNSIRKRIYLYNKNLPKGMDRLPYSVISDVRKKMIKDRNKNRR